MTTHLPVAPRRPGRGRLAAALALQCLPLLAATSCVARGAQGEAAQQAWFLDVRWLVVASALSWGLGYLPLRRWGRAAVVFLAGVIGNVLAANVALGAWSGAPDGGGEDALRRAALTWGSLMLAAVLLLLADTWCLVRRAVPAGTRPDRRAPAPQSSTEVR